MLVECEQPKDSSVFDGRFNCQWFTWNPRFRAFAQDLLESRYLPKAVALRNVRGCEPYEGTYDISLESLPPASHREFLRWCRQMEKLRPSSKMCLLNDMILGDGSGSDLRRIFAALRRGVISTTGNAKTCLYSPVTPESSDEGFPLHSDRFMTSRLLLVFDDVTKDKSGASTFLSKSDLLKKLRQDELIARKRHEQVAHLMSATPRRDSFDRLYAALYPGDLSQTETLGQSKRINFKRGQGYLIDDRHWLHGREACSGRVSKFRFHRLTF